MIDPTKHLLSQTEICTQIAPWLGLTIPQTKLVMTTFFEEVGNALRRGQAVHLNGVGMLRVVVRAPTVRIVGRTGRRELPERAGVKFIVNRELREDVAQLTHLPTKEG